MIESSSSMIYLLSLFHYLFCVAHRHTQRHTHILSYAPFTFLCQSCWQQLVLLGTAFHHLLSLSLSLYRQLFLSCLCCVCARAIDIVVVETMREYTRSP